MTFYLWTLSLNETSRGQTMASQTHSHRQARSEKQMLSVCVCVCVEMLCIHEDTSTPSVGESGQNSSDSQTGRPKAGQTEQPTIP